MSGSLKSSSCSSMAGAMCCAFSSHGGAWPLPACSCVCMYYETELFSAEARKETKEASKCRMLSQFLPILNSLQEQVGKRETQNKISKI